MQYVGLSLSGYLLLRLLMPNFFEIQKIKRNFKHLAKDKNFINFENRRISVINIEFFSWGFRTVIDLSGICSFEDIERKQDYIKQLFRAREIIMLNENGTAIIDVINKKVDELKYKFVELSNTTLLLGYDNKGEQIKVNMLITPHIGVQGASNSGKSKMIEVALKNLKNADIILLNTFEDDFVSIKARRINGNERILDFLKSLIENPYVRERPLYILLDELNVLGKDKNINRAIMDVLAQARHYNIYLIALGQSLLKENCPYKQLFNVRITFRTIDKSSISAFLGCTVEDTQLKQREFICYSDRIIRGKSYLTG